MIKIVLNVLPPNAWNVLKDTPLTIKTDAGNAQIIAITAFTSQANALNARNHT